MKYCSLWVMVIAALGCACGDPAEQDAFRAQIDQAKKETAGTDFSVSTYAVDSSRNWKVTTEIIQRRKAGTKMTGVKIDFKQGDQQIGTATKDFAERLEFRGQVFGVDARDSTHLYLLWQHEQGSSYLLKVSCNSRGAASVEELDSTTASDWTDIKTHILDSNR